MKPLRNDCFALPPGVNWTPVVRPLSVCVHGYILWWRLSAPFPSPR